MNENRVARPGDKRPAATAGTGAWRAPTGTDQVALWASARVTELIGDQRQPVPAYGTQEWQQLGTNDQRRFAAVLTAAELWRQYGDEDALLAWFKEASAPHAPIAERRTLAELDALAQPRPTRPVQASEGWPPVAIPGRPGWYRCLRDGRQVDVQKRQVAA
ncbi:hypothetical protein ABZ016_23885 [Streptomyces sp. NPDC006372]|uniref:hypothetical protein n=1 Tax=Streptomyces sp. NPDC006372 TaxID=3155599 RepID=UPI00339E8D4A